MPLPTARRQCKQRALSPGLWSQPSHSHIATSTILCGLAQAARGAKDRRQACADAGLPSEPSTGRGHPTLTQHDPCLHTCQAHTDFAHRGLSAAAQQSCRPDQRHSAVASPASQASRTHRALKAARGFVLQSPPQLVTTAGCERAKSRQHTYR